MHITFSVAPAKMKIYFAIYYIYTFLTIIKHFYGSWSLKSANIRSFSYENYAIRVLTFYSIKTCLQFFLNPSMRILSQKSCLIFTYCNVKIQPLPFKSPTFFEILASKKIAKTFLSRRVWGVRIARNRFVPYFSMYDFLLQSFQTPQPWEMYFVFLKQWKGIVLLRYSSTIHIMGKAKTT